MSASADGTEAPATPASSAAPSTSAAAAEGNELKAPSPAELARALRRGIDLRTRRLKTTSRLVIAVAGVPSVTLLVIGIIVWARGAVVRDAVLGIMITGMAATVGTGVVVTAILLAREAELARMQSEFVSRVSHDLRTPLTSIKLFVETLQLGRAQDPAMVAECLDALGSETSRLLAMVDRLLDFSRIESARREYVARRASINVVVARALEAFESLRVQGNVQLTTALADPAPDVDADPDALVDALLNLLQNAWHYTPKDDKQISVTVTQKGGDVEVRIADNGPGVAPSERNKIFERFYRGAASRALQVAGTGLGLAMVRSILHTHRGEVSVEANEPKGAVFVVTLPVAERPR